MLYILVVTTTLTRTNIRLRESNRLISICVTKDLETAIEFNVTIQTVEGTATSELVDTTLHSISILEQS